jgi:hypothetical protein
LGQVHTKTLNRLQEAMNTFDFDIIYKKGSEMPADYLSRNLVSAISWDSAELLQAQTADPWSELSRTFYLTRSFLMIPNVNRWSDFSPMTASLKAGWVVPHQTSV